MEINQELINGLKTGSVFLFLGQNYLKNYFGYDYILEYFKKINRLGEKDSLSYSDLLNQRNKFTIESLSNINNTALNIPFIESIKQITRIPWQGVYTSSYDPNLERFFKNEWRDVNPLVNETQQNKFRRSKQKLNLCYLLGCLNQSYEDTYKLPPENFVDYQIKKLNSARINFTYLKELMLPKTFLILEGFDPLSDLIPSEVICSIVDSLSEPSYLFNYNQNYKNDKLLQHLIEQKKLIPFEESLSSFLFTLEQNGNFEILKPIGEDYAGKWITSTTKRFKISIEQWLQINEHCRIIDDSYFALDNKPKSNIDSIIEYREFLASSSIEPKWSGYSKGFAFTRSYYKALNDLVLGKYKKFTHSDEIPIILYGQTSSGKTVSLGLLAYHLRKLSIPVLYINRNTKNSDNIERALSDFCDFVSPDIVVVIWDGNLQSEEDYYDILLKVNSLGKKIILVGSCYPLYKKILNSNFIEAPIKLSEGELTDFDKYYRKFVGHHSVTKKKILEENFLAILYHQLPFTRNSIRTGIKKEVIESKKWLSEKIPYKKFEFNGLTRELLKAGIISEEKINNQKLSDKEISLIDDLILYVFIPSQFHQSVPFDLLLRTLSLNSFLNSALEQLKSLDLIKWNEDEFSGNIFLTSRTALEAKIFIENLKLADSTFDQIKYIINIIQNLKETSVSSDLETKFIVQLLINIGPGNFAKDTVSTSDLYRICTALKKLRENSNLKIPSIMLQEASYLRTVADSIISGKANEIENNQKIEIDSILKDAELVILDAIQIINEGKQNIQKSASFLIDLASTRRVQGKVAMSQNDKVKAIENLKQSKKGILNMSINSISKRDKFYALSNIVSTFILLKGISEDHNDIDPEELSTIHSFFETMQIEELNPEFEGQFYEKFYQLKTIIDSNVSEELIADLIAEKKPIGYYLNTRRKIQSIRIDRDKERKFTREEVQMYAHAYKYMYEYFEIINKDDRCLFLLFQLFWYHKSESNFFSQEQQKLKFSKNDWNISYDILSKLLQSENYSNVLYLKYFYALTLFHLDDFHQSMDVFKEIDNQSKYQDMGIKRIKKFHICINENGEPKKFNGIVNRLPTQREKYRIGKFLIPTTQTYIDFDLNDWNNIEIGQSKDFYIAFGFREPIALKELK